MAGKKRTADQPEERSGVAVSADTSIEKEWLIRHKRIAAPADQAAAAGKAKE